MARLLGSFPDVFDKGVRAEPLRGVEPVKVALLPGAVPQKFEYAVHDLRRDALEAEIQKLVDFRVIEARPGNPFGFPAFVVPKKSAPGEPRRWRLVVNARPLTKLTVSPGVVPLNYRSIVALAGGNPYKAAMDIPFAFYCVAVHPDSQAVFGLCANGRTYVFLRLPMGWTGSPATLTNALDVVLRDMPWLARWLDDLLVVAPSFDAFMGRFRALLERCRQHNLPLKPSS